MKDRIKSLAAVAVVIVLLPYVMTMFLNGKTGQPVKVINEGSQSGRSIIMEENGIKETIDLEEYLVESLAAQIPVSYEKEALKAQAVIVRSSLIKEMGDNKQIDQGALSQKSISIGQMHKVWNEEAFLNNYQKLEQAVEETKGIVIKYKGVVPELPFHSVSSGKTRNGSEVLGITDAEYLTSVDSLKDIEAQNYLKISTFSATDIMNACKEKYPELNLEKGSLAGQIQILKKDSAEYILQLKIGNIQISGEEFRKYLDLNSSCFIIDQADDNIKITTRGLGHGVGLSQYGADRLASEGKSCYDILNFYYKNIEITNE